jgi:hypothetical protein
MEIRIDRRGFVESLIALPVGIFLVRCSSGSSGNSGYGNPSSGNPTSGNQMGSNAPAAAPSVSGTQITYTTSEVESHFHTFAIAFSDLSNPPSNGVSGETSTTLSHFHTVMVSMSDLQNVEMGESMMVTTGVTSGHSHVFTFVKVAGAGSHDGGAITVP